MGRSQSTMDIEIRSTALADGSEIWCRIRSNSAVAAGANGRNGLRRTKTRRTPMRRNLREFVGEFGDRRYLGAADLRVTTARSRQTRRADGVGSPRTAWDETVFFGFVSCGRVARQVASCCLFHTLRVANRGIRATKWRSRFCVSSTDERLRVGIGPVFERLPIVDTACRSK